MMFGQGRWLLGAVSLVFTLWETALAQAQGSVGLGVGTIRSSEGSSFSSASLSPAFRLESSNLFVAAGATLASLPRGVWSGQGRLNLWAATPALVARLSLGLDGAGAATLRTDGLRSAALHGLGEVLWAGPTWGLALGAGPSAGWITDQPSVTALHTRARFWWQQGRVTLTGSAEPTRFLGAWFTDLSAGVAVSRSPVVAAGWFFARRSESYGSKEAAAAMVQLFVFPNLALEAGGGSYLPDPYEGLPRTRYLTAGIRWFTARRAPSRQAAPLPLRPEWRGDSVVVRFLMPGARSLAIAGSWNAWEPVPLASQGNDLWQGVLAVPEGRHRFILLVNGSEWVVPGGVEHVKDARGGLAAVLIVERN